ncbi:hypothetical protein [Streptomyces naphthomycinicus]|uniref:hypothetical protein n=1 Tax=Streptomyces naphthomycinicus TaxID=2872625 RepID=UPI001CECC7FF|nr:hypothetical protein [Streptomyces sp. TML10]
MDDTQKAQDPQTPRDSSTPARSLPLRRVSVAVAGAATLVALGVGVALAAPSDHHSRPARSVTDTLPPDSDTGGSGSGGPTDGDGTAGGTSDGSTSDGSTDGGSVSGSGSTGGLVDGGGSVGADGGTDHTPDPSGEPTGSVDLSELNRRVTELDKKVDQLPTKKELADALRAFADELDHGGSSATPAPDPS